MMKLFWSSWFATALTLGLVVCGGTKLPAQPTATNAGEFAPMVSFADASISVVIENISRRIGVNYLLKPSVTKLWSESPEPAINLRMENVNLREMLTRLLEVNRLALREISGTGLVCIMPAAETNLPVDAAVLNWVTNNQVETNLQDFVISFAETPLDTALEILARRAGGKFDIAPHLLDGSRLPETISSLRWENVSCRQAIVALCVNYDLPVGIDENGVVHIRPSTAAAVSSVKIKTQSDWLRVLGLMTPLVLLALVVLLLLKRKATGMAL